MSCRHARRRDNRARLKADCVILLDRLAARLTASESGGHLVGLTDREKVMISEMRMRLAPPTGVKAPIVFTNFTRGRR